MSRVVPAPIFGQNSSSTAHVIDGSLHFTRSPAVKLTRINAVEGNRGAFTLSCWVKNSTEYDYTYLLGVSSACSVYISNTRELRMDIYDSSETVWALNVKSERLFRDESAWHHIVLALDSSVGGGTDGRNSDRLRLYVNGVSTPLTFGTFSGWGTLITGNIRDLNNEGQTHQINSRPNANYHNSFNLCEYNFIDGLQLGPQYFGFTDPLTGTWRPKKFIAEGTTYNNGTVWSSGSTVTGGSIANADKGFDGLLAAGGYCNLIATNTSTTANVTFAADLKDVRKLEVFAHSTSSSGDTRGTCQTAGGKTYTSKSLTSASQDFHTIYEGPEIDLINVGWGINQNGQTGTTSDGFRAFRVNGEFLIDSTTRNLDFGVNGVYLPMDNADDFEIDKSGKGNNYTKTNWAGTDSDPDVVKDSPSGPAFGGSPTSGITTTSSGPANYCTLNPNDGFVSTIDGNLETVNSSGWQGIRATLGMKSGKFYWETQNNQDAAAILGIADTEATGFVDGAIFGSTGHSGGDANPAWTWAGANYYFNATSAASGSLANHTSSDIVQYAFDADNGKLWFGRNGTWYSSSWETTGDPANGVNPTVSGINTTKTYVACGSFFSGSAKFNFGQKPFKYAPPQGFLPINSANTTPVNVIPRPDRYFGMTLYYGDPGAGTIQDDTIKFTPDFVWVKSRGNTEGHALYDSVRGPLKRLRTNTQEEEINNANELTSFIDGGFTANNNGHIFYDGYTYHGWMWKAGGSGSDSFYIDDVGYATAAAAGLDGGSIDPNGASVGTKQGFSIIRYTGTDETSNTFAHGLTQKPDLAIIKNLSQAGDDWIVYHSVLGATKRVKLNGDDGYDSQTSQFNDTEPTSSLFTIGTYDNINKLNNNYIAYLWHDVPGLQKFGGYVGNGSDNGPYIQTGFRPRLIWIRAYDGSGITNNAGWFMYDTLSDSNPYNNDSAANKPGNYITYAHLNNPLQSHASMGIDILSNGFKLREDPSAYSNYNGWSYIYAAFAETPVSNLYGGQSLGR